MVTVVSWAPDEWQMLLGIKTPLPSLPAPSPSSSYSIFMLLLLNGNNSRLTRAPWAQTHFSRTSLRVKKSGLSLSPSLISNLCLLVTEVHAQVRHDQRERAHQPSAHSQHACTYPSGSVGLQVGVVLKSKSGDDPIFSFSQAMPHINYALRQAGHSDTVADELTRALGLLAAHGVWMLVDNCYFPDSY